MKPKPIKLEIPARLLPYLQELRHTGLYGSTVEEVAETLVLDQLKHLIGTKLLTIRSIS